MKIAIRFGLLITAVVIGWIVIVRFLMGVGGESKVNLLAPILFNLAQFVAIFLGIRAREREVGGAITFKQGVQTGLAISFVYAFSACIFFAIEYFVAGPKLLMTEGSLSRPMWQIALQAYLGLFFGSIVLGVIYSAVISFFLARRLRG